MESSDFKLKNRPRKPVRKLSVSLTKCITPVTGDCLLKALLGAQSKGADLKNMYLEAQTDLETCSSYCNIVYLYWKEDESDRAYDARITNFYIRLEEYNKWEEDNKEDILAAKEASEKVKALRDAKNLKIKELRQKIKELE